MRGMDSSIGRLMFATLTLGVGIVTMRSQSDFWLGVLVSLAAVWGLDAAGVLLDTRTRGPKLPAGVFLIVTSACLVYGFGPWSDVSTRGKLPNNSKGMTPYVARLKPVTIGLFGIMNVVEPRRKSVLRVDNAKLQVRAEVEIHGGRKYQAGNDQLIYEIERYLDPNWDIFTRTGIGPGYDDVDINYDIYFDGSYLTLSLIAGWLAAGSMRMIVGRRSRTQRSSISDETK